MLLGDYSLAAFGNSVTTTVWRSPDKLLGEKYDLFASGALGNRPQSPAMRTGPATEIVGPVQSKNVGPLILK